VNVSTARLIVTDLPAKELEARPSYAVVEFSAKTRSVKADGAASG
jgi:hypothetical protein